MSTVNVALIPLRGGSKSIPGKNIKPIAGQPLCAWTLRAAADAIRISRVYVSTDSREISDVVFGLGLDLEIIDRPAEFATDDASTESVMLHLLEKVPPFDNLVTIQATSPLLEPQQLDDALNQFEVGQFDSMVSVVRSKRFFWQEDGTPINYDPLHRPRRQDFRGILMENGAFYITKASLLAQSACRLGGKIGMYEMPAEAGVEIDDPHDWDVVQHLLEQGQRRRQW